MPIYAFECGDCGHQFERLQKLSDTDPDVCPVCEHRSVRRQLTAPSFRLAGGGWYETDFKKDGDKKRNLADTGAPAPAPAGDSKSGETKAGESKAKPEAPAPAAKTESKPAPAAD